VPTACEVTNNRYNWAAPGDVNAFFGLMLDNIADLLLAVGLLHEVFAFPTEFALRRMVPGTAIGVLVGDLLFFGMALALARRTGRNNITAMPLGLDTPSTFGMVFFVLGPAFLHAQNQLGLSPDEAARYTWHIGTCAIFVSGLFKLACAAGANWVRHLLPRAGLLGSLAAVALVLISFLPLLEIAQMPVVGLIALSIILTTLVARVRLPFRIPGALGALLVAGTLYYLMRSMGLLTHVPELPIDPRQGLLPYEWLEVFQFRWLARMPDALNYLPIVIPFALGTVVGGIDCTESAAAAGDEFDTRRVIGVEAVATLAAGLCGGVIQTTPYIGHPAYKAMGGRAAYTLATALFVGGAGLLGYFGFLYWLIPKPTVFPIMVFIGMEINEQSFRATPTKHYPAVALACVPALAALAMLFVDNLLGDPALFAAGISLDKLQVELREQIVVTRILANGFIVTSLLWASALAALIDRRLRAAAVFFLIAAGLCAFGIIHSPFPGGRIFLPWQLDSTELQYPLRFTIGYLLVAALLCCWGTWKNAVEHKTPPLEETSE
jgi:AGZA family xanthine/uracil permease-like MFS transporter